MLLVLAFALVAGLNAFFSASHIATLKGRVAQLEGEVEGLRRDTASTQAALESLRDSRTRVRTITNK